MYPLPLPERVEGEVLASLEQALARGAAVISVLRHRGNAARATVVIRWRGPRSDRRRIKQIVTLDPGTAFLSSVRDARLGAGSVIQEPLLRFAPHDRPDPSPPNLVASAATR
jgi:hypothetical protein